jgi:hypothetical protein
MATRYFGARTKRTEDFRLVTGRGRYTDDIGAGSSEGLQTLEAAFLRSPHAHARILDIDVSEAIELEGVIAIYTYEDLEDAAAFPLPVLIPHPALHAPRTNHALAKDVVRHVGEGPGVEVGPPAALRVAVGHPARDHGALARGGGESSYGIHDVGEHRRPPLAVRGGEDPLRVDDDQPGVGVHGLSLSESDFAPGQGRTDISGHRSPDRQPLMGTR